MEEIRVIVPHVSYNFYARSHGTVGSLNGRLRVLPRQSHLSSIVERRPARKSVRRKVPCARRNASPEPGAGVPSLAGARKRCAGKFLVTRHVSRFQVFWYFYFLSTGTLKADAPVDS